MVALPQTAAPNTISFPKVVVIEPGSNVLGPKVVSTTGVLAWSTAEIPTASTMRTNTVPVPVDIVQVTVSAAALVADEW
jgi:hypothetical protein